MIDQIRKRVENNYERESELLLRDIMYLLKMAERERTRAERYWEQLNAAELRVVELEEIVEELTGVK